MNAMNISEKIQSILDEIGAGPLLAQSAETATKSKLTAQEIAHLLAGRSALEGNPKSANEQVRQGVPVFSMDSFALEQTKMAVNERWQIHYYRPIYSCRRFVGRAIVFGKRVVRKLLKFLIEPLVEEQNQFNSAVTQNLNVLRNNDVVFQAAVDYFGDAFRKNALVMGEIRDETMQKLTVLHGETTEELNKLRCEAAEGLDALKDKTTQMLDQINAENRRLAKALQQLQKQNESENIYDTIDYWAFQEHMRGSYTEIKKRQLPYMSYFTGCENVVDLGCGRGEFLEILQEHGIHAVGVDLYEKSVQFCRAKGFTVAEEDAVEFLKAQKAESVDGIFSAQLIEHIPVRSILELCRESYRVLKSGSYLVLETPNPMCLSTYMNSFYLDPTHKNPIHPHFLEYLLQECGFSNVLINFNQESKVGYRFPMLHVENCKNLSEFNDGINFLSDIIWGSQDYAVVAQKSKA